MKLITFHSEADAEVNEAAQFYETRSPGLGSALLDEVQRSLMEAGLSGGLSGRKA